jgi:hypothetical protein
MYYIHKTTGKSAAIGIAVFISPLYRLNTQPFSQVDLTTQSYIPNNSNLDPNYLHRIALCST